MLKSMYFADFVGLSHLQIRKYDSLHFRYVVFGSLLINCKNKLICAFSVILFAPQKSDVPWMKRINNNNPEMELR